MIKVVKGNVVLQVKESLMDHYVNKGYTAKSLDGKIIKEAVPSDIQSLKKAYLQIKAENETLKEEIKELKSKLDRTNQPIVQAASTEDKPKRTRKRVSDGE